MTKCKCNVINHVTKVNSFSTNTAAGKLRCVDSAIESVLEYDSAEIDSALILKDEQRNAIKAFVDGKYIFAVLPTGFCKS